MNNNSSYKPPRLYTVWPVVLLLLFFGTAISLWDSHHILSIVVAAVGIFVYAFIERFLTNMIREELTFRELFKNW